MLEKLKRDKRGFTLVELIVVVVILGVLMAVLVPQYIQYVERSRIAADEAYIGEIAHAMEIVYATREDISTKLTESNLTTVIVKTDSWGVAGKDGHIGPGAVLTESEAILQRELEMILGKGGEIRSRLYKDAIANNQYYNGIPVALMNGKAMWTPLSAQ